MLDQKQQKESLKSHNVASRPWAKVGADLCSLYWKDFLVTVDYYGNWRRNFCLSNTTSISVIRRRKQQFARHCVLDIVVTDNGSKFSCHEFCEFAKEWQFHHTTSSPGYSQSNGKADNVIKTVKRLLKRAYQLQSDLWLTLLTFMNTPTEHCKLVRCKCCSVVAQKYSYQLPNNFLDLTFQQALNKSSRLPKPTSNNIQ